MRQRFLTTFEFSARTRGSIVAIANAPPPAAIRWKNVRRLNTSDELMAKQSTLQAYNVAPNHTAYSCRMGRESNCDAAESPMIFFPPGSHCNRERPRQMAM